MMPSQADAALGEEDPARAALRLVRVVERLEAVADPGEPAEDPSVPSKGNRTKRVVSKRPTDSKTVRPGPEPGPGDGVYGLPADPGPKTVADPAALTTDLAADAFATQLVAGILAHLTDIDGVLSAVAQEWPLAHLAAVDRAILRLGAHELLYTDTPAPIIINDAVELARRYSTEESPRFVNGVLGALAPTSGTPNTHRGSRDFRRSGRGSGGKPDATGQARRVARENPTQGAAGEAAREPASPLGTHAEGQPVQGAPQRP